MLENAPEHMPRIMPMTAAIAPTFAKRYPEAAIIFDNLHAMHDVISDILTSEQVVRADKRRAILEAGRRYRESSSFLMPVAEWSTMGEMMGVANMGGPAVGLLTGWPTPTLERGVSMLEAMKLMPGMGSMPGMSTDSSHAAMGHAPDSTHAAMGHAPGPMGASGQSTNDMSGMSMSANDSALSALHARMMRDPVIHARVMADTAMRRLMEQATAQPAVRKPTAKTPARSRAKSSKKPVARRAAKPSSKPKAPNDMNMPDMHH